MFAIPGRKPPETLRVCQATRLGQNCTLPEGHVIPHATWNVAAQCYDVWPTR